MKSIVLIIPYFGKLPYYFNVWQKTALCNPSVDFMFFTDVEGIKEKGNIKVVNITFDEFAKKIQSKFDFDISVETAYKLCDYRMAFGLALQEYLKGYDFWGYCDIDLVFGDIRAFITDEVLNENDKILEHGHFTLYRNNSEINSLFMKSAGFKDYDYKKVFTLKDNYYFDEILGGRLICRKLGVKTYLNENIFFDALEKFKPFTHITKGFKNTVFLWKEGKLFALEQTETEITKKEIMYAHFQKRKMDYSAFNEQLSEFYLVPNKLVCADKVKGLKGIFSCRGKRLYILKKKIEHVKTYIKRYKKGNYKSFSAYRKERSAFALDMKNAKKEIEKWGEN